MRVAITGGTGTLGRGVVEELQARGHDVRVLSRHSETYPVDLTTGAGLSVALEGCDVVVDASNSTKVKVAREILVDGARRLAEAEKAAGVRHHVCVSIIGCEKVPTGYYQVKIDQEQAVEQGGVPWTIVRATQFHDLAVMVFSATARFGILLALNVPLQTVAVADVAPAIADRVEGEPLTDRYDVAGPEVLGLRDLARVWKRTTGSRAVPVSVPLPGRMGRALRAGALTDDQPDVRGKITFEEWLVSRR